MKRKIFTMAALICTFIFSVGITTNAIDGNWTGPVSADGENHTLNYYFKVEGDKITGTSYQDEDEPKAINVGKIDGNDFTFSFSDRDGETFPMTGKYYANGDSIALRIDYQGAKLHVRLKRVADK